MGVHVGDTVGEADGCIVGAFESNTDWLVGAMVGVNVGAQEGDTVGNNVGFLDVGLLDVGDNVGLLTSDGERGVGVLRRIGIDECAGGAKVAAADRLR